MAWILNQCEFSGEAENSTWPIMLFRVRASGRLFKLKKKNEEMTVSQGEMRLLIWAISGFASYKKANRQENYRTSLSSIPHNLVQPQ